MVLKPKNKKLISVGLASLILLIGCNVFINDNVESKYNFVDSSESNLFIKDMMNSHNNLKMSEKEAIKLKERVEFIKKKQSIPDRLKLKNIDGLTLKQIEKNHRGNLI
jgi:hypothetical protein